MIRAPEFWRQDGAIARALSPLSRIAAAVTARRMARPGWRADVPVICCGNATVGGAGKTTVVLDLARRLMARGIEVHVLLRGYHGNARGPRRVMSNDDVQIVGDEALLLAAVAPTWTGADRAASARAAIAAGAAVLLMDDGLQNPTLEKTLSLLIVDGATMFGNRRVFPAGPLRESVEAAAARCGAAVLIGGGDAHALPAGLPVLRATLAQTGDLDTLAGQRVLAFAGLAIPDKFFDALVSLGASLIARVPFPDHHVFTMAERDDLRARADAAGAILVTTPKDAARLPAGFPIHVVGVRLVWDDEAAIEALLDRAIQAAPRPRPPE